MGNMHIYLQFLQIQDIDNVRCGMNENEESNVDGKVIWKLTDSDLCPPINTLLITSISVSVLSKKI